MQLSSSEPCVVILTEKEVEVSVNNRATFTLPKKLPGRLRVQQ